jgi:hypothetical protein
MMTTIDERVLARMNPQYQQAVIFHMQHGLGQKRAARLLGCCTGTVRKALREYQALLTIPGYETTDERRTREREERLAWLREEAERAAEERERAAEEREQAAARAFDPAAVPSDVLRAAMRPADSLSAMLPLRIRVAIVLLRESHRPRSALSA